MLRGQYRAEILVKVDTGSSMSRAREHIRHVIAEVAKINDIKSVRVDVDVDAL